MASAQSMGKNIYWKWAFVKIIMVAFFYPIHTLKTDENHLPLRININQAILIGTTNSVILQTIKAKNRSFKMAISEKWRNYLPRVGVSYFGLRNVNENQEDSRYNDIRLNIQQLIYDGGETDLQVETAKLDKLLNTKDYLISRAKLELEIRKNYIEVLSNIGKLHLIKKSYQKTKKEIKDANLERKTGFKTEYERLQSLAKLRQIEYSYTKLYGQANRSIIDLKILLNLDQRTDLIFEEELFRDYYIYPPYLSVKKIAQTATLRKQEVKKSQATIENIKKQKEIAENYWQPKVSVGAYVGENVNGPLPTRNKVYGLNFSVTARLGSSTSNTSGNYGIQERGTGIQRIEGYGPQFVGKGENVYNSSNLQLFDDYSYARKILEGKIQLSEAIKNHRSLKNSIIGEVHKKYDLVLEKWQLIRISNSNVFLQNKAYQIARSKYQQGFVKNAEVLQAEIELLQSQDKLADAIKEYLQAAGEFLYAAGLKQGEVKFFQYRKHGGNSLIFKLYPNYWQNRIMAGTTTEPQRRQQQRQQETPTSRHESDIFQSEEQDMEYFFE